MHHLGSLELASVSADARSLVVRSSLILCRLLGGFGDLVQVHSCGDFGLGGEQTFLPGVYCYPVGPALELHLYSCTYVPYLLEPLLSRSRMVIGVSFRVTRTCLVGTFSLDVREVFTIDHALVSVNPDCQPDCLCISNTLIN